MDTFNAKIKYMQRGVELRWVPKLYTWIEQKCGT